MVQTGVSLVLQCRPPAGLPPPVIFWMDNSELFARTHICRHDTRTPVFHKSNDNGPADEHYCYYLMSACFSLCHLDFQKLPLDKRVSQALNGDLYFSNVLPEDSRPDYICYARFPHTQTIQQKQPISVTVLNSKFRHGTELLN